MAILLLLAIIIHSADNSPVRIKRSPRDIGAIGPHSILLSTLQNTGTRLVPVFAQNGQSHSLSVLPQHLVVKNDGSHLVAPIPLSQFYLHSKLHLVPRPNVIQTVQHDVKIPVISHHSVSHTSPNANTTSSSSIIPVFIHGIIPLQSNHDLSVIPLQRHKDHQIQKAGHYRMEKNNDDDEEMSRYRNYYGGHGAGLFFGGHGHGHGFYAYGK